MRWLQNRVLPVCAVLALSFPSWSAEPAPTAAVQPQGVQLYVLLRNGDYLVGRVSREVNYVVVDDGQTRLRVKRNDVKFVAANLQSLYEYQRAKASDRSPDQQLSLVKWCTDNDLLPAAVFHLAKAKHLRPTHPDIPRLQSRLVVRLEDRDDLDRGDPLAYIKNSPAVGPELIPANTLPPEKTEPVFSRVVVAKFSSRVQPVMMNRCALAQCHGHAADNKFALRKVPGIKQQPRAITQHNLALVATYLDSDTPADTKLLKKATTIHGDSKSKLLVLTEKQRAVVENWIVSAIKERVHSAEVESPNALANEHYEPKSLTPPQINANHAIQPVGFRKPAPEIKDPFDPAIFNQGFEKKDREDDRDL